MNKFSTSRLENFNFVALLLGALFLPIFLVHFTAHTDGYFIITKKGDWLGDPEGSIMFMQGRPLGAFLNSFIGWFTNSVEHLTLLRVFVFVLKIWICHLLYSFCLRLNIEKRWALLLAFYFILLPSNIINVIWVANGVPECLSLLFGVLSYVLLNRVERFKDWMNISGASFCFLIALLMYQPMATIVFGFMFIKMLFAKRSNWTSVRLRVIGEICFYGIFLLLYWVLIKRLILPLGVTFFNLSPTDFPMYQMDLVKNVSMKYNLVCDLLRYSMLGIWDVVLHYHVRQEWMIIALAVLVAMGFALSYLWRQFTKPVISIAFQKLVFGMVLFALANAPSLMPVNYLTVVGYRTFLSSSLMALSVMIYYFRFVFISLQDTAQKVAVYVLSVVLFLTLLCASWVICLNVSNYAREYQFIDQFASQIDYHKTKQILIVLNPPGETLIEYTLPFEMGLMATMPNHVQHIFDKYSLKVHERPEIIGHYREWSMYEDEYTRVLDMSMFRHQQKISNKPPERVLVHINAPAGQKVLPVIERRTEYPVFNFKHIDIDGTQRPYWAIVPGVLQGTMNLDYITEAQRFVGYRMTAICKNPKGEEASFAFKWQGSNDRKAWVDLSEESWQPSQGILEKQTFFVSNNTPFKHLRLIFTKQNLSDVLVIKGVWMFRIPLSY